MCSFKKDILALSSLFRSVFFVFCIMEGDFYQVSKLWKQPVSYLEVLADLRTFWLVFRENYVGRLSFYWILCSVAFVDLLGWNTSFFLHLFVYLWRLCSFNLLFSILGCIFEEQKLCTFLTRSYDFLNKNGTISCWK